MTDDFDDFDSLPLLENFKEEMSVDYLKRDIAFSIIGAHLEDEFTGFDAVRFVFELTGCTIKVKDYDQGLFLYQKPNDVNSYQELYSSFYKLSKKYFPLASFNKRQDLTDEEIIQFFTTQDKLKKRYSEVEPFSLVYINNLIDKNKEHIESLNKSLTPYEPVYQLEKFTDVMALAHSPAKTAIQLSLPFIETADPGFFNLVIDSIESQETIKEELSKLLNNNNIGESKKEAGALYLKGHLLMGQSVGIDSYLWLKRTLSRIKVDSNGKPPAIIGDFDSFTQLAEIICGDSKYSNDVKAVFYFLSKVDFQFADGIGEHQSLLWIDHYLGKENQELPSFRMFVSNRLLPGFSMPEKKRRSLHIANSYMKRNVPLPENIPVYSNKGAAIHKLTAILFNLWLTQTEVENIASYGYFTLNFDGFYNFLRNRKLSVDKRTIAKLVDHWKKTEYIVPIGDNWKLGESEEKSWNYLIDTGKMIISGRKRQAGNKNK